MFTQDQINNKKALIGKISNGYKIDKNDLIIDQVQIIQKW